MEIAVLGGGNGSMAAAVDLTEMGHNVRLWRRNTDAQVALRQANNTLVLKDFQGERPVRLSMVTTDMAEAVKDAELIVCPTPATAQIDIAMGLSTCLMDGQVVLMPPGSFGSWIMAKAMQDAGNTADVSFAESGTLPSDAHARTANCCDHHTRYATADWGVPATERRSCFCRDAQSVSQHRGLRRCPVWRADECRADHTPTADPYECRTHRAF